MTTEAQPVHAIEPPYRLPPGPHTPGILNALLFLGAREWLIRMQPRFFGGALTVKMPMFGTTVIVCSPELAKQVFTAKPDVLHAGDANPLGEVLGPGSLFSMDEEEHLKERRMLLPPFHGERMRSYEPLVEEEALRAMAAWPDGQEFATIKTFNTITLRVILRAVFGAEGRELAELERQLPAMTKLGQKLVAAPFLRRDLGPRSPGGRLNRMRERYNALVDALVDGHLADPGLDERIDILALMLRASLEAGEEINRAHLADELLTLLVAGHETTASSLAWTVEILRRRPDIVARLERELVEGGSTLRTSVANEVHRTRPVIGGTGRVVRKPFELGEWRLPPGTLLVIAGGILHQDERHHPHAGDFDPDRYVDRKPDTYAWVPFGGGARRCIGAAFAAMEMDVVVRTLLANFELVPTGARPERRVFRGVADAPRRGGRVIVRRRRVPLPGAAAEPAAAAGACPVDHGRTVPG